MHESRGMTRRTVLCLMTMLLASLLLVFGCCRYYTQNSQVQDAKNLAQSALSSFTDYQDNREEAAFRQGAAAFHEFYRASRELEEMPTQMRQTCGRVHAYLLYQPERAREHMEPLMAGLAALAKNPASMDAYADLNLFLQEVHVPGTEG
ncbi:MAG: hypothetical protein LUF28_01080 [Clostridiales bacterium]|nr:hypothetical protein [Clostridiales bacterium]